jgi:hypothetical protein
MTEAAPALKFKSHIEGKNAEVAIWADRIEWSRAGEVSKGKLALSTVTVGLSLLGTGVRKSGDSSVLPISSVSAVNTKRDGLMNDLIQVISSGTLAVEFRVSHKEAPLIRDTIMGLVETSRRTPEPHVEVVTASPLPTPAPATALATDPAEQLKKLADLHQSGLLTDEEFAAKRAAIVDKL